MAENSGDAPILKATQNELPPLAKEGWGGFALLNYNPNNKNNARLLRKNMTNAERLIWSRVRRKQILDVQFYRQKPIENFIVDFYAPKIKLVIEIDGSQHF